jgi:TonB family protein
MKIEIGVDGKVRSLELGRGLGLGLDEQAAAALLKWKFTPGAVNGQPVPVRANVEINFRLL